MKPSFDKPKAPGRLSDDASRYVVQHRSKFYGPWTVEAERPTWRDVWAVLRGRYQPKLTVSIRLNMTGVSRTLEDVWTGPSIKRKMYEASPLLVPLVKREDEAT